MTPADILLVAWHPGQTAWQVVGLGQGDRLNFCLALPLPKPPFTPSSMHRDHVPSNSTDTLAEPGSLNLLRGLGLLILLGGTVTMVFNLMASLSLLDRPSPPVAILTGLGMLLMVHRRYLRAAAHILCWGLLFVSVLGAYKTLGLHGVSWSLAIMAIMMTGWLLGRTMALWMTAVATGFAAYFYYLHLGQHVFRQSYPLNVVAVSLVVILLAAALMASATANTFQRQLRQRAESWAELDALFDSTEDIIWSVDAHQFGLLRFNTAFSRYMANYRDVRVYKGMVLAAQFPQPAVQRQWSQFYRRALQEESFMTELIALGDGQPYQVRFSVMRQGGEAFGISVFARCIARQKAYEQELARHRDHLESLVEVRTHELTEARESAEVARLQADTANRAKSLFLANMSHEIRTPLTAIIGFSEHLLDTTADPATRTRAVQTILRNGHHLLELISNILDISKIEADRLDIESLRFSLPDFLADIDALGVSMAQSRGLGFHTQAIPPLPDTIESDPTRLKQILLNLIGNAVKFTEPPGTVRLIVSFDPPQQHLILTVLDTGIGMSREEVARLFQPFVQADVSTTRRFGGTGLGLSISRELARRLGGDIEVFSLSKVGSEFVVIIATGPLDTVTLLEQPAQCVALHSRPQIAGSIRLDGHILLAEDQPDNQQLISLLIQRTGARVSVAANGQEAVEMAQGIEFDLVLMDMQMPVVGGLDAARMLRLTGFDRPVIMLTANATEADRQEAFAAGCNGFLTKPVNQADFYATLALYLTRQTRGNKVSAPANSMDDDPAYRQLKQHFFQELPGRIDELIQAFGQEDWPTLQGKLHQLKGIAGSFGFPDASRIAAQLEHQLREGQRQELASGLERLRQSLNG